MAALLSGTVAPEFSLKGVDGKSVSLAETLKNGPALVAFFKVSCPTCQFALPFIQRLHEAYGGANVAFLAVSQDAAADTREFMAEFGLKLPVLLDNDGYVASKSYGLTNVPSLFWIDSDGRVQISSVGFSKADLEKVSAEAARAAGKPVKSIFRLGERIPEFKAG
ncbi:MAG: TlpA family protein disulfide reductase [Acidobacteriota bacterium]|nr:TlpA family protein disulfide reductase [Acidobacteriota bacterium]MDE3168922.1 TlpA family protein disulfide reductase [Acidobacteriota bacterium]